MLVLMMVCVADAEEPGFSYDDYAVVLKGYVDAHGMVDYKGLKANRGALDAFARAIGGLNRNIYDKWTDAEKIAFWLNAYNSLTLKAIIDHYPIESSWTKSLVYPRNSIRQIPGVWDKLQFAVMGKKMTLDGMEHDVLRREFKEPRIHVALVCAAMSCPTLRNEPYAGAKLDEQLSDQARLFLGNNDKFQADRNGGRVHVSPIFKWFAADFVKDYGTNDRFGGRDESERAVLNFVSAYLGSEDAEYIRGERYEIRYLKYDWSLNEQKK